MEQTKYTLSIAIVTRNRPESLQRALESLSNQNTQAFEIVISDDSNLEEMIAANKELASAYGAKHIISEQWTTITSFRIII
jgi:glycosyltransferase involved in cell wall biosynthesis